MSRTGTMVSWPMMSPEAVSGRYARPAGIVVVVQSDERTATTRAERGGPSPCVVLFVGVRGVRSGHVALARDVLASDAGTWTTVEHNHSSLHLAAPALQRTPSVAYGLQYGAP
eukprot:4835627-Prymnesium_polylepis.1